VKTFLLPRVSPGEGRGRSAEDGEPRSVAARFLLAPEDLVALLIGGGAESMNARDEEWGEE